MLRKLTKFKSLFGIIILLLFVIAFSYARAIKEPDAGDFHVFWLAGKKLLEGKDIYYIDPGLRNFIYPPFAAFAFIPFSLLPFKLATFLFMMLNFTLAASSIILVKKILGHLEIDKKIIKFSILGGCFFSFKLMWNNIMMVQSNQLVFFVTLLGIYYFLVKKNENLSILFTAIAISLKIYPILFAIWIVIRGKPSAFFKFVIAAFVFITLPFIFSGVSFGIEQLEWYYTNFILKSMSGSHLSYANQSLTGVFNRLFSGEIAVGEPNYTLINLGKMNTSLITKLSKGILLIYFFISLIYSRLKKIDNSIYEACLTIVLIHLISTVTWKAHLVSLLLPFTLFSHFVVSRRKSLNWGYKLIIVIFSANALLGQMFVGKKGQLLMNGYGEYTIVMMILFLHFAYRQIKLIVDNVDGSK